MHIKYKEPEFKIERGIKIPQKGDFSRFGFLRRMKVGESFFVPKDSDVKDIALYREANVSQIHIRIVGYEEGMRVWRICNPKKIKMRSEKKHHEIK